MDEEELGSKNKEDFENEKEEVEHVADAYGVEKDDADEIITIANEYGVDEDDAYELWQAGV